MSSPRTRTSRALTVATAATAPPVAVEVIHCFVTVVTALAGVRRDVMMASAAPTYVAHGHGVRRNAAHSARGFVTDVAAHTAMTRVATAPTARTIATFCMAGAPLRT